MLDLFPCAPGTRQACTRAKSFLATLIASITWLPMEPIAASAAEKHATQQAPAATAEAKAPTVNWSGCYGGVNGGGAASGSDVTSNLKAGSYLSDPSDIVAVAKIGSGSINDSRLIGGGQVGCNIQSGTFVFGIEGDWDSLGTKAGSTASGMLVSSGDTFSINNSVTANWLATIRPRVGVAAGSSFIYFTGGVAFANFGFTQIYSDTAGAAGSASASRTQTGWTLGAGFETMWTTNWSIKVDYLFAKFGTINGTGEIISTTATSNGLQGSADLAVQSVRIGLNYKL
jgi:outer membrane immunogenic protein